MNKATSLVVVAFALPFRAGTLPLETVLASWPIIVNLLSGSLLGAWLGAGYATRLSSAGLQRIIAILLVLIALVLVFPHEPSTASSPPLAGGALIVAGVIAGLGIGVVASLLGVAGGELLIPTLVLLFGADIKLAGSLSLAISLPTMITGFTRYSRDKSFEVLDQNRRFVVTMACGSIVGVLIGGQLLGVVPNAVLLPGLALILIVSAIKTWMHQRGEASPHPASAPHPGDRPR